MGERGKPAPTPYIKRPQGEEENNTIGIEEVPLEELSSPPHVPPLSFISLPLLWLPKGCIGVRSTPPLHAIVLREFQI
jgi:hypothetical protein